MTDNEVQDDPYADIPNQIEAIQMAKTHEFNIMLIGLSGVGKSSLVRSLFCGKIKPKEVDGGPKLNEYCQIIEDNGVMLRVTCTETSNFTTHDPNTYRDYLKSKLEKYFVDEQRLTAADIHDNRIHSCLYLIPPHGKMRLMDEDIECMKAIHEWANLIPIITKSESYDSMQRAKFKENISAQLKKNGINHFVFSFDEREDEERAYIVKQLAERFPFAIVTADEPIIENNRYRWLRKTGSCVIDIYDPEYDFEALQKLLLLHCLLNQKSSTNLDHYAKVHSHLINNPSAMRELGLDESFIHEFECMHAGVKPCKERLKNELQALRDRLETLRQRNAQSRPEKPETPRKKPAVQDKPDYLRRISDLRRVH